VLNLARQRRPGVIVLSVDLPRGQNGYLPVGKARTRIPGVRWSSWGTPRGFSAHAKLKNRADEYTAAGRHPGAGRGWWAG
jgi:hypothetical protein